jgi:hypothetical protein
MVIKASGPDNVAESFVADDSSTTKRGRPKGSRNKNPDTKIAQARKLREALKTDGSVRDQTGQGFNDCPSDPDPASGTTLSPPVANSKALASYYWRSPNLFSEDGWLILPKDLPFEGYKEIVECFGSLRQNMLWIAGDLQVQGQSLYGEKYSQVVEALAVRGGFTDKDYTETTLGLAMRLSEIFPAGERHKDLSWNHHKIVMALPEKERAHWLARASAENLTTRELTAQIAAGNGGPRIAKPKPALTRSEAATAPAILQERNDEPEDPDLGVAAPAQLEARNGVSLEMLQRADLTDKAWYDALDRSIDDFKTTGSFDYDTLRGPTRALAAELIDLIKALGEPRAGEGNLRTAI